VALAVSVDPAWQEGLVSSRVVYEEDRDYEGVSLGLDERDEIVRVELIKRSYYLNQCPAENDKLPEIAVFGRSNVGKSSMINYLCKRRMLSTISKHPGHTRLIHHFLVNNSWYLVDLPGIGFAEGKAETLRAMDRMVDEYMSQRKTLLRVLYLVDGSLPPQDIDLRSLRWFAESKIPLSIVFTKTDKDPSRRLHPLGPAEGMAEALLGLESSPWAEGSELPPMFSTSSKAKLGREEVLGHIGDVKRERLKDLRRAQKEMKAQERERQKLSPPPSIR